VKSPEESGEPENPTEKNPPRSNGKRPNDTLAIVSYWTRISLGLAIIGLLVAHLLPAMNTVASGPPDLWFRNMRRLQTAIETYSIVFESPPIGRVTEILSVLQSIENPSGWEKTPFTQMVDENFRDIAFSERPLSKEINSRRLARFAAYGKGKYEDTLFLMADDGSKSKLQAYGDNRRPAKSFLDRPVDEILKENNAL